MMTWLLPHSSVGCKLQTSGETRGHQDEGHPRPRPEVYQIENTTQSSANRSPKRGGEVEKQKAQPGPPKKTPSRAIRTINKPARNRAKVHGDEIDLTQFKICIDQVYNAIKGHEIIKHLRPHSSKPKGPEAEEYCGLKVDLTFSQFGRPPSRDRAQPGRPRPVGVPPPTSSTLIGA